MIMLPTMNPFVQIPEVTTVTNTETNEVDLREVVFQILKENSRETVTLLPIKVAIGSTQLTITKAAVNSDTTVTKVIIQVNIIAQVVTFTISENTDVDLLKVILFLKLRDESLESNQTFIERSARQIQTHGVVVVDSVTTIVVSKAIQVVDTSIETLAVATRGSKIQQMEPFVNREHIVLTFVSILMVVLFSITLKQTIVPLISESINLKRNLNFTAEPAEVD